MVGDSTLRSNEAKNLRHAPGKSVKDAGSNLSGDELPAGTALLHGQYTVESYLNSGGFGITYCARDSLGRLVVIKECFPSVLCRRDGNRIEPRKIEYAVELSRLIEQFVSEAHALAALKHKNILHVHQVFEENDTAYMAIDFIDGPDLMQVISDAPENLSPDEIMRITRRTLGAIKYVHSKGILHRDISPDNILIDPSGEPVLIDFGAALRSNTVPGRVFSKVKFVKDGYSPQEFYIEGADQGTYSDVYGFAATLYHTISGAPPVDAQHRTSAVAQGQPDPYIPLNGYSEHYPEAFLVAIDRALAIMPLDRLQTADEWLDLIPARPSRILSRQVSYAASRSRPVSTSALKTRLLIDPPESVLAPNIPSEAASPEAAAAPDLAPADGAMPDADFDASFSLAKDVEDQDYDIDDLEEEEAPVDLRVFAPFLDDEPDTEATENPNIDPSGDIQLDPLEEAIAETAKPADEPVEAAIARVLKTEDQPAEVEQDTQEAAPKSRAGLWVVGGASGALAVIALIGASTLLGGPKSENASAEQVSGIAALDIPPPPPDPAVNAELDTSASDRAADEASAARDAAIAEAVARAQADAELEAQRAAEAQERDAFLEAVEGSATPTVASANISGQTPPSAELSAGVVTNETQVELDLASAPALPDPIVADGTPATDLAADRPEVFGADVSADTFEPTSPVFASALPGVELATSTVNRIAAMVAPSKAAAEVQPEIDETPPVALPKPPLLGTQIISSHWDVAMPFASEMEQVRNSTTVRLTEITDPEVATKSGAWVAEGTVIYALNGQSLRAGVPLSGHLLDSLTIDPDGYTRASVRYKDVATGRIDRGLLTVPVKRDIRLADGTTLTYRGSDGGWLVDVVATPQTREDGLRPGDILVRESTTGIGIANEDALAAAFEQLVASDTGTARFIVDRGGSQSEVRFNLARDRSP